MEPQFFPRGIELHDVFDFAALGVVVAMEAAVAIYVIVLAVRAVRAHDRLRPGAAKWLQGLKSRAQAGIPPRQD